MSAWVIRKSVAGSGVALSAGKLTSSIARFWRDRDIEQGIGFLGVRTGPLIAP